METTTDDIAELAEKFGLDTDRLDPEDIDPKLVRVMQYIDQNTGLLGDYNTGLVRFAEGDRIIQWYGRSRYLSAHDNLLNWVQMEADGVLLASIGVRTNPNTATKTPYAEIHLAENWGYDDE